MEHIQEAISFTYCLKIRLHFNNIWSKPTRDSNAVQVDFQVEAQIGHIDNIPSGLWAGYFYSFIGELID